MLHTAKGEDSNLGLTNRNAGLLGNVRYTRNQCGGLMTNVCIMKNRLTHLIVFNRVSNNASYVTNRQTKCRQSYQVFGSVGMFYPGATLDVQAYHYNEYVNPG